MKIAFIVSIILNLILLYYIAKRFYYHRVPPVLWEYDIAMLGDSQIERGTWNKLLSCRVANFGKGKTTVEQAYQKLPGIINCKPKICFIQTGINDIVNEMPQETTLSFYEKIITELKQAGIKPVIVEVFPTAFPDINKQVENLNEKLRAIGATLKVDITQDDLQRDGIHLEGSGYSKWALAIKELTQF